MAAMLVFIRRVSVRLRAFMSKLVSLLMKHTLEAVVGVVVTPIISSLILAQPPQNPTPTMSTPTVMTTPRFTPPAFSVPRLLYTLRYPGRSWISEVRYAPDGRRLAVASNDEAWLYDVQNFGQTPHQLEPHKRAALSAAWSPDGRFLASGSRDNIVRIWDTLTRELVRELMGHAGDVVSAAWSPDGRFIASGSWDGTVRIWGIPEG